MTYIIQAKNIQKSFSRTDEPVLQDINLGIKEGEAVAIMGASGEGKSTLLHLLGLLDSPTKGQLFYREKSYEVLCPHTLRQDHYGFLFQSFYLFEEDTSLQNILLPAKLKRLSTKRGSPSYTRAEGLLSEVGLPSKAHVPVKLLSGGERQRIALARALCNNPEVILADEPTGNLDHNTSQIIHELLLSRVRSHNKTLVVVTHDPHLAALCDRTLYLEAGTIQEVSADSHI